MFSLQKWSSWSLVVVISSVVALVLVVHIVLPTGESFLDDFWGREVKSSSFQVIGKKEQGKTVVPKNGSDGSNMLVNDTIHRSKQTNESAEKEKGNDNIMKQAMGNLTVQYPADSRNAVIYRGAPWKAEIGRWLSGCDAKAAAVKIVEEIGGKSCKNDCSGQGVCNHEFGLCSCFHGFDGEDCSQRLQLSCNLTGSKENPYGPWIVSICSAHCDTTRAMCFCGEGTKYPNRPLAEACGFEINPPSEPGGPRLSNWSRPDVDVFTTNASIRGWCNVDPKDAYAGKVRFKEECDCKYDGLFGRFCEVPVESVCINQCAGHGHCRGGFCQCDKGWFGVDCSMPSVSSPVTEWPKWLRTAQIQVSGNADQSGQISNLNAAIEKKRPLIYVYDLPPEFNSLLLEGRHFKLECVNRIYDPRNATLWTEQLYGAQMAIFESILASPHRTLNGEEADYFFVPVLDSCIITRADDAPHISLKDHRGLRSSLTLEYYKKAYKHIRTQYPYWNQSSGRDHIWSFMWDEGACYAPKEIWNSMMLVHWGNTNSKHNHSTTAYWADNWDNISEERRGKHPCFDPDKDLVLPAWKRPDENALKSNFWAWPREKRSTFFYFNGNLGPAYVNGRPEDTYSMGIRQKVAEEFGSSPNKKGELGKQHATDVVVTPLRTDHYHEELASSIFCGVMPGDGWSGRMEDSIYQGCIPVVIQDGIYLPYENVLNYKSFAVRIKEDEIPNLIKILRGFTDEEIDYKLANVKKLWQRFVYRDAVLLEAERQKNALGLVEGWSGEFSQLLEDDVLATFIQVLHYKLHNDPWRRGLKRPTKEYGVPGECLMR